MNQQPKLPESWPSFAYAVAATCSTTRARVGRMTLAHGEVSTPVFMPVGTQGTMKGLLPEQVANTGCGIMLSNTYHLGSRPGADVVAEAGGLHRFMNWKRAVLTDSGGFQMVSLSDLMSVNEEGVRFKSPYTAEEMLMTPEESIRIQNALGADIAMQLDDVVHVLTKGERVVEAVHRSVRWLDRCLAAHGRRHDQQIFAIIQGGLDLSLRSECARLMTQRDVPGFAIGGLSGGEAKDDFWKVVKHTSELLPDAKPRYCMGVGHAVDILVCVALGVDMFDCVFPTRTARFGCALVRRGGQLNLKKSQFKRDLRPIDENCPCSTCKRHSRAFLNSIVTREPNACHLVSIHNVTFMMELMKDVRRAITEDKYPQFVQDYVAEAFVDGVVPTWVREALAAVNVAV